MVKYKMDASKGGIIRCLPVDFDDTDWLDVTCVGDSYVKLRHARTNEGIDCKDFYERMLRTTRKVKKNVSIDPELVPEGINFSAYVADLIKQDSARQEGALHYYAMVYITEGQSGYTIAGFPDKELTLARINQQAERLMPGKKVSLSGASYLGYMTPEEFRRN